MEAERISTQTGRTTDLMIHATKQSLLGGTVIRKPGPAPFGQPHLLNPDSAPRSRAKISPFPWGMSVGI